jgi:hypothetical protein
MTDLPGDLDKEDIDREALVEFVIEQLTNETLARDAFNEAKKKQAIEESLFGENPEIAFDLVNTILLTSNVSKREVDYYIDNEEECSKIYDMVVSDFDSGEVSEELRSIHEDNIEPVLSKIDDLIEARKKDIFGSKYEEIQEIKQSERDNKDDILQSIKEPFKKDSSNENLWNDIDYLNKEKKRVKSFPYSKKDFEGGVNAISGDERAIEKYYAVQIWNPELFTMVYRFEEDYEEFPLKWLSLPVPQIRLLYRRWQDTGEVPGEYLVKEVQSDGYLDELYTETQKVPFFKQREDILSEVIANYRDERYASVINLILPQIESFIWIYAAYLQEHKNEDIILNASFDDFWSFNPRDYDELSLKNTSGKEMESPSVKDLISKTVVQNYINEEVVEYFVEELFVERNPILHGNVSDYHSEEEASKKIIFFNHLLEEVTEVITGDLAEKFNEEVDFDTDISDLASDETDS